MPLLNPSQVGEIITTTLRYRDSKVADNVSLNNALLARLEKKGNSRPIPGGRSITQPMEYAANGTVAAYSGYEPINVSPQDVLTSSEYNWAQYAGAISVSGLEMLQNTGKAQIIDLVAQRVKNAEHSLRNRVAVDLYSDGSGYGGRQIGGLQLFVSATPTAGVVGGIDRSTTAGAFWRNQKRSCLGDGGAAASIGNIQDNMHKLYLGKLVRGADKTDLIVADNIMYTLYLESLTAIQRVTSDTDASAGFTSLKYMGADVILDGGLGGGAPTSTMYFLNTSYIYYRPHADRNFTPIGDDRQSINQDATVKLMGWAGNMTASNLQLQGVLTA